MRSFAQRLSGPRRQSVCARRGELSGAVLAHYQEGVNVSAYDEEEAHQPEEKEVLFQLGKGQTRRVFLCVDKRSGLLCLAKQGSDECNEAEQKPVDLLMLKSGGAHPHLMRKWGEY